MGILTSSLDYLHRHHTAIKSLADDAPIKPAAVAVAAKPRKVPHFKATERLGLLLNVWQATEIMQPGDRLHIEILRDTAAVDVK